MAVFSIKLSGNGYIYVRDIFRPLLLFIVSTFRASSDLRIKKWNKESEPKVKIRKEANSPKSLEIYRQITRRLSGNQFPLERGGTRDEERRGRGCELQRVSQTDTQDSRTLHRNNFTGIYDSGKIQTTRLISFYPSPVIYPPPDTITGGRTFAYHFAFQRISSLTFSLSLPLSPK